MTKIRADLGKANRRASEARRESMPALVANNQMQEVYDLKRQLGEIKHRLQKVRTTCFYLFFVLMTAFCRAHHRRRSKCE